jgi:hypothetical protein
MSQTLQCITLKKIVDTWEWCYGENMNEEYSGFIEKLKEDDVCTKEDKEKLENYDDKNQELKLQIEELKELTKPLYNAEKEWIEDYINDLPESMDDDMYIDGHENPSYNYKSVMEQDMVQASEEHEEEHGFSFPNIEDGWHKDVGVLGDILESHFKMNEDRWYKEDDESDDDESDDDDDDDEKQKQEEERKKKYEKSLQFDIETIFSCGAMQPFHCDEHYKEMIHFYLTKKIKTYEEYYQYCIKNSESSIRIEAIENQIKISKEQEEERQEELKKEQEEEEKQEREEKQKKEEEDKDDDEEEEEEEEDDDEDDESDDEEDDQYTFKKLKEGLEERGITKAKQSQIRSINQKWRECKTFDFKETKKSYMILYYDENKKQISKNIFSK